jgi:preprotein translocase subunit YajC
MNTITTIMANAAQPPVQQGGGFTAFLPIIIIFAIFYFILIRPQQRKEKERKQQINELRAGAKILFAGGLIGTIAEVKESTFMVEIAPNTIIEIARGAVLRTIKDGETPSVEAR